MPKKKPCHPAKKSFKKKTKHKPKKTNGPKPIGKITHYFNKIQVGIIKLKAPFKVGSYITIRGRGSEFTQKVVSMQRNRQDIQVGKKGWEIGIKVDSVVREGALVFLEKKFAKPSSPMFAYQSMFQPRAAGNPRPQAKPTQKKPGGYTGTKFLSF